MFLHALGVLVQSGSRLEISALEVMDPYLIYIYIYIQAVLLNLAILGSLGSLGNTCMLGALG